MPSSLCETSFYLTQMLDPVFFWKKKNAPQDKQEPFKYHETKISLKFRISLSKTGYSNFTLFNWKLSVNNRTMYVNTWQRAKELQSS